MAKNVDIETKSAIQRFCSKAFKINKELNEFWVRDLVAQVADNGPNITNQQAALLWLIGEFQIFKEQIEEHFELKITDVDKPWAGKGKA